MIEGESNISYKNEQTPISSEQAKFEEACNEGKKRMKMLEKEYDGSDYLLSFESFTHTCKEKSKDCINTAISRVISLSHTNDSEVSVLMNSGRAGIGGGRWGSKGEMGTGEYIYEVLGSKCSPLNIGRLVTIMKTIPSSDYIRFENMRMDAYRIERVVIEGRSFLHDCAPEAYKLICAMIEYYDARNDSDLLPQKREALRELFIRLRNEHKAGYTGRHEEYIFDLDNYEKTARDYSGDYIGISKYNKRVNEEQIYDGDKGEVKAIDILRRLKKNMEPIPLNAPHTKIPELNEAFERLGQVQIDEKGEFKISIDDLSDIVKIINKHLIDNQGERTLYPSTISSIAYIDKLATAAIRHLSKKELQEIAYDPTFKEIIRFSQLTMSKSYNEREFEIFYSTFRHKIRDSFGRDYVDEDKIFEAYQILATQVLKNAEAVGESFSDNENLTYLSEAVWSGNLTHELIGLGERLHQ
ncbi:hypothetical protein J6Z48_03080 [bacterium]|nr:hypothetical protein [bacterium]